MVNLAPFWQRGWGADREKVNLASFSFLSRLYSLFLETCISPLSQGFSEGCCQKPSGGMECSTFSKAPFPFRKQWCSRTLAEIANFCLSAGAKIFRPAAVLPAFFLPSHNLGSKVALKTGEFSLPTTSGILLLDDSFFLLACGINCLLTLIVLQGEK